MEFAIYFCLAWSHSDCSALHALQRFVNSNSVKIKYWQKVEWINGWRFGLHFCE